MYGNRPKYKLMQQKHAAAAGIKIAVIGMSASEELTELRFYKQPYQRSRCHKTPR